MNNLEELLSLSDMEATQKLISEGFNVKAIYEIGKMVGRYQRMQEESILLLKKNHDDRINGDETYTETTEHGGCDEQTEEVNA